jgi:hypothetical protein
MCRKDAKWPAIVRDVPQFSRNGGDKKTWSMSQDEIADFVAAVRIRSDNAGEEVDRLRLQLDSLRDENVKLKLTLAAYEAGRVSSRKAESLGVEPDMVRQIGEAASGAVSNLQKAS